MSATFETMEGNSTGLDLQVGDVYAIPPVTHYLMLGLFPLLNAGHSGSTCEVLRECGSDCVAAVFT